MPRERLSQQVVEQVHVPGATLWTASRGAGIPLALCHGGPGLCDNLGAVAEMIEDLALVHRYDQRGSGRSVSDGPFDAASFVADLEALRRHWGHERWVVGGHSWGANLALLYALEHPDRTSGVVYLAGSGLRRELLAEVRSVRAARLTADEREELASLQPRLAQGDAAAEARFLRLIWTADFADRERARRFLDEQPLYRFPRNERVAREVTRSWDALATPDLVDRVRQLAVPVLVVHGAHDVPARAREVAELVPDGRWAELTDSAHVPWLEEPERLRDVLRGFLQGLG